MKKKFPVILLFFTCCISLFSQDTWSTKASLNVARTGAAAGVINGKLYVVGGSPAGTSLEVYDPTTNAWTTLANMPTDRAYPSAAVVNNNLYVIGGCIGSDCNNMTAVVEMYDPAINSWTTKASAPGVRSLSACAAIGNKIYVAGSCGAGCASATSAAAVYDATANSWTSIASLPVVLSHAGGAAINGKFYVMGGSNGSTAQNALYEYDPSANTWISKAAMPTARSGMGTGVINNLIYAASGQGTSSPTNVLEVYNSATNTWSTKAPIPTIRYSPATAAIGAVLYVAGSSSTNTAITTVEAFSAGTAPTIQTFTPTSGVVGVTVTITGTNFSSTASSNIVYFGATKASVSIATSTQLTVTVPVGATHQPITVTVNNLTAYSQKYFVPTFAGTGTMTASSFAARENFATASSPWSIVAADIDGDGKTDLAAPNYTPAPNNVISVFRNTSAANDPNLAAKTDFACLGSPTSIASGDFDGDGKTDLTGGNVNSLFSVFKNLSTSGTVSLTNRLDLSAGGALHGQPPAVGDLNNDGKPDFAGSDGTVATSFYVYKNTSTVSTISFASALSVAGAVGTLKMADFDADGFTDVISANGNSNTLSVFRNTTVSDLITFATKVDLATNTRPLYLAIGDVDGDGKLDVATANNNNGGAGSISVFRNTSTPGTISFALKSDFTTGSGPTELDLGDIDGDDKIDIAVANQNSNTISILKNQSTSGAISFATKIDFSSGGAPQGVVIADIDGDRAPEICFNNNQENTISVVRNLMAGGQWTTKGSLTSGRWGSGAGNINGVMYVAGGYTPTTHLTNVDAYTLVTNIWTAKASRPTVQTNPAYGVINGILYTAGGTNTSVEITDLYSYNPASDTWTSRAALPSVRQGACAGVISDQLYVAGGLALSTSSNALVVYDPVANSWTSKASMLNARHSAAAGAINGLLYVAGGTSAGTATGVLEAYNPVNNTWTTLTAMPAARYAAAYAVTDGVLYVMGGLNSSGTVVATVEAYNPTTNTWTTKNPMTYARAYANAVVQNGLVYVSGGHNSANAAVPQVEEFNPGTIPGNAPTITNFNPTSGTVGTSVTITGTNFDVTPANNMVKFNGTTATITGTPNTTSIVTSVPAGATTGPVTVTVGGVTATSASSFTVLATQPTTQPTNLTFPSLASTSLTGNFQAATGNPDGYLILFSVNVAPDITPVDGVAYAYNEYMGSVSGNNVYNVGQGNATSFNLEDLTPSQTLYFKVFAYNGSGSTTNYLTTAPLQGNVTTPAFPSEPTTQTSAIQFINQSATSLQVSWTSGNGTSRLVLMREGLAINQQPVDGTTYTGTSVFTVGDDLGASNYVVYNGTGNSVTITSLSAGNTYHVQVFEYNGGAGSENYLLSSASGNPSSFAFTGIVDNPPTVSTFSPLDNASGVAINSNLVITFNELVQKGTGNIVVREGSSITQTIAVTNASVTISGSTVTIDPSNFTAGAAVNVQMAAGVIEDLAGNDFAGILNATTWNFTVATDGSAPTITDNTPTTVTAGANLTITATIVDNESAITAATVEYRSITAGGSTTTTNLTANGSTYSTTINSSAIGDLGIEYKISATSTGGTTSTGTAFKNVQVIPSGTVGLTVPYTSFGSSVSSYRIVAVPLELSSKTVSSVFEELGPYDPEKWRMFRYDNGETNEISGSTQMSPGQGFWLIIKNNPGNAINSGSGNSVNVTTDTPLEIDLDNGWNQIGNPYNFNLSWADVVAANPGLSTVLRVYEGSFSNSDRLKKMQGGFVNNSGSLQKLKFPVVKNAGVQGGRMGEEQTIQNDLTNADWHVTLEIKSGEQTNLISGFGMHPNASDGFDVYDGVNMPRFFDDFLILNHSKKVHDDFYSKEFVQTAAEHVWDFFVESSSRNPIVTFNWNNTYFGENDKELYLWDVDLQRAIDMRTSNSYSFNKTLSKSFRAIFGSKDFVNEEIAVSELVLHSPWPNPSAGDVAFSFTLPESTEAQPVEFTVADMMGRQMWNATQNFESGYHEMLWKRMKDEAPGIYFIRLQSGSVTKQTRFVLK